MPRVFRNRDAERFRFPAWQARIPAYPEWDLKNGSAKPALGLFTPFWN